MWVWKASNRHPLRFIEAGNFVNEDGFLHTRRCLDFFALLVGLEGTLYIAQNGVRYTLGPKEFMLLMPGMVHEGYLPSDNLVSYFWCHFAPPQDSSLVEEAVVQQHLADLELSGMDKDLYLLPEHGNVTNPNQIALEFRRLIDFAMQSMYSTAVTDYAASLLVMSLTQEYLHQHDEHTTLSSSSLGMSEVQAYIRLHYSDPLSVPMLADLFGYNPNYLSTVFKRATGESLVHAINRTRIAAAKTLLFDTKETVAAIATQVGFSDSKYFIRIFRKFTGVTPITYRTTYFRKKVNKE